MHLHQPQAPILDICKSCHSLDVINDHCTGDVVCRSCGTVLGDRLIDDGAEWRNYLDDDRGSGNSARSAMKAGDEDGLATTFSGGTKDLREMLNRANSQIVTRQAKLHENLNHISELAFKLGVSDSTMVSFFIFKKEFPLIHREMFVKNAKVSIGPTFFAQRDRLHPTP
jgi:transcription initiation factor TFIIIB Brf1 subunit/transcription initiation factor TFIIB